MDGLSENNLDIMNMYCCVGVLLAFTQLNQVCCFETGIQLKLCRCNQADLISEGDPMPKDHLNFFKVLISLS